jgi:hypothetical protein
MLQGDPACRYNNLKLVLCNFKHFHNYLSRPAVDIVLNDEFMTCGYMPTRLPLSCLTMAPRFDAKLNSSIIAVRRPLGEVNRVHLPGTAEHPQGSSNTSKQHIGADTNNTFCLCVCLLCLGDGLAPSNEPNHAENAGALYTAGPSPEKLLRELQQQLTRLFSAKPAEKFPLMMGACLKYLNINKIALTYLIVDIRRGRGSGFSAYGMDF